MVGVSSRERSWGIQEATGIQGPGWDAKVHQSLLRVVLPEGSTRPRLLKIHDLPHCHAGLLAQNSGGHIHTALQRHLASSGVTEQQERSAVPWHAVV